MLINRDNIAWCWPMCKEMKHNRLFSRFCRGHPFYFLASWLRLLSDEPRSFSPTRMHLLSMCLRACPPICYSPGLLQPLLEILGKGAPDSFPLACPGLLIKHLIKEKSPFSVSFILLPLLGRLHFNRRLFPMPPTLTPLVRLAVLVMNPVCPLRHLLMPCFMRHLSCFPLARCACLRGLLTVAVGNPFPQYAAMGCWGMICSARLPHLRPFEALKLAAECGKSAARASRVILSTSVPLSCISALTASTHSMSPSVEGIPSTLSFASPKFWGPLSLIRMTPLFSTASQRNTPLSSGAESGGSGQSSLQERESGLCPKLSAGPGLALSSGSDSTNPSCCSAWTFFCVLCPPTFSARSPS
jgi:hypothetical protein